MARGSTLLYEGGEKVKVRAAGALGIFPVSFDIGNPMFANARGHKLTESGKAVTRLVKKQQDVKLVGKTKLEGRDTFVLELNGSIDNDLEITRQVYGIDAETFVITSTEMYIDTELVSRYLAKNVKINPELSDDFFEV